VARVWLRFAVNAVCALGISTSGRSGCGSRQRCRPAVVDPQRCEQDCDTSDSHEGEHGNDLHHTPYNPLGFIAKFAAHGAEAQLSCEGEGKVRQR